MAAKRRAEIPFAFVLEELEAISPRTKPMFGCTAIYHGSKIVLILRDKKDYVEDNGVWLATSPEHHESLRRLFPSMRSLGLFGSDKPTSWQNLPANSEDFEESVLKACQMVLKGDPRIGKVPNSQRKIRSTKKITKKKK